MKEYGGYFELEPFSGKEYHTDNILRFNYGRTALQFLLISQKIRKVYLPYYICDSVITAIQKLGIEIEYYSISPQFLPLFDKTVNDNERMLIVNYYGLLSDEQIKDYIETPERVILDNTHAFFRKPFDGVNTVYSCRKFFGVPDGGYLSARSVTMNLPEDRSESRLDFLVGRLEESASSYYANYRDAEIAAENEGIKKMSKFTQRLLCGIDYNHVKNVRTSNFVQLQTLLENVNLLGNLPVPEGAYMYPLLVDGNADELRAYLHQHKLYVPTLWKNVLETVKEHSVEAQYADSIIPLPVDQRYNLEDMHVIANIVKRGIAK